MTDDEIREHLKKNERKAKEKLMQKQQEKINKLFNDSGIGERFKNKTLDNFEITDENKKGLEIARNFIENFPDTNGIIFIGEVGRGKTHLAAAITNQLIHELYKVIFGNITSIIGTIRKSYQKESQMSEFNIINQLATVDLLVIDDLGKEHTSENNKSIVYQVINQRYENYRPIIITTNLEPPTDFEERYGDYATSRLIEMCDIARLKGEDWRFRE